MGHGGNAVAAVPSRLPPRIFAKRFQTFSIVGQWVSGNWSKSIQYLVKECPEFGQRVSSDSHCVWYVGIRACILDWSRAKRKRTESQKKRLSFPGSFFRAAASRADRHLPLSGRVYLTPCRLTEKTKGIGEEKGAGLIYLRIRISSKTAKILATLTGLCRFLVKMRTFLCGLGRVDILV